MYHWEFEVSNVEPRREDSCDISRRTGRAVGGVVDRGWLFSDQARIVE